MTILVDIPRWNWRGKTWCHLVSDTSLHELHDFAFQLGLKRIGFQGDHYDIDEHHHVIARDLGAELVDSRELVHRLKLAGLRVRPRSFEKWNLVGEFPDWSLNQWLALCGDDNDRLRELVVDLNLADSAIADGFQLRRSEADALVLQGRGVGPESKDDPERGRFYRREVVDPFRWSLELITPCPAASD